MQDMGKAVQLCADEQKRSVKRINNELRNHESKLTLMQKSNIYSTLKNKKGKLLNVLLNEKKLCCQSRVATIDMARTIRVALACKQKRQKRKQSTGPNWKRFSARFYFIHKHNVPYIHI